VIPAASRIDGACPGGGDWLEAAVGIGARLGAAERVRQGVTRSSAGRLREGGGNAPFGGVPLDPHAGRLARAGGEAR
jgi:hypothetical protein